MIYYPLVCAYISNNSCLVVKSKAIILPLSYPVISISFESITSKLWPQNYSYICSYFVSFDKFQNSKVESPDIKTNYSNSLHHFMSDIEFEFLFSVYTYWWVSISNILISYGLSPPIAILDVSGIRVQQ